MSQENKMPQCNCGFDLVEDDMAHVGDYKKPRCESCRDELAEAGIEPGEDDDVESCCCCECEESFKFDEPVDALDYHTGNHKFRCPECMEMDTANCYGCLRIYNESEGDGGGYCSDKCYHDTVERRKALDNKLESE